MQNDRTGFNGRCKSLKNSLTIRFEMENDKLESQCGKQKETCFHTGIPNCGIIGSLAIELNG